MNWYSISTHSGKRASMPNFPWSKKAFK
jgi:hypothetical protein